MATAQDAITRIREQISDDIPDASGNYRWSDTIMFRLLWDGVLHIAGDHPEALYLESIVVIDLHNIDEISALTDTLPIRNDYLTALVDWVASRIQLGDSEDSANLVLSDQHKNLAAEAKE